MSAITRGLGFIAALALLLVPITITQADTTVGPHPDVPGIVTDPPHSIRLLFGTDAATTMTLAWGSSTTGPAFAEYTGPNGKSHLVKAETYRFPVSRYQSTNSVTGNNGEITAWYGVGYINVARLDGLDPGTAYDYRVGSDALGWSPPFTFRTAPTSYDGPFVFTASGDTHPGPQTSNNVVGAARFDPAFNLQLGDVSYAQTNRATQEEWWAVWFQEQQPLMTRAAFMPAMGNHDVDQMNNSNLYKFYGATDRYWYHSQIFPMPDAAIAPAWSFKWGDVAVVSVWLDDESRPMRAHHVDYLDQELAKYPDAKWRVVTTHAAPYSSSTNHGSACKAREQIAPILAKHGVDLVLSGHDHQYERTFPVDPATGMTVLPEDPNAYVKGSGVTYVVEGAGGPPILYDFTDPPSDVCNPTGELAPVDWSAVRWRAHSFVKVEETEEGLHVQTLAGVGAVPLDDFWIRG